MDRICAKMPTNLRDFLFALPVIQGYQAMLGVEAHQGSRDPNYQVTLRVDDKFSYFEPCFQVLNESKPVVDYTGWNVQERGEYDCFINFDEEMFERARALARPTKRHITDALGILIGGHSPKWPILAPLQLTSHDHEDEILLLPFKGVELLENLLCSVYSFDRAEHAFHGQELSAWIDVVTHYSTIIGEGYPYPTIYLAAALKKSVIEIFPDSESQFLYNSTGRPNYRSIVGDVSAEVIFAMFEDMREQHVTVS